MGSVPSLYSSQSARNACYACNGTKVDNLQVAGKTQRVECRQYTPFGLALETMESAQNAELSKSRLIEVIDIGVDTARFINDRRFDFDVQSEGGGGLSKYQCGADYQVPKFIKHEKLGYTARLYVHTEVCTREFISSELQDWAFPNDTYEDGTMTETGFTDALINAGRGAMARAISNTDIIGVFGGANKNANMYDGILAQAYWAYTMNAYFHSMKFTVDPTELVSGYFLHAKYAGLMLTLEFDDTQASDPTLERYETLPELYARLVDWLNEEVKTEGGKSYVSATFLGNDIIVTANWTAQWIDLSLNVSANADANWLACDVYFGVSYVTLQGVMPIDERPFLVPFQPYTLDNILSALPNDIYMGMKDVDNNWLGMGRQWALYIDNKVWEMYKQARTIRSVNQPQGSLEEKFQYIFPLASLSNFNGTGLWFVTAIEADGQPESKRNIKHLVDSLNNPSMPMVKVGEDCDTIKMKYDQLHGVLVKDFRLFISNLLCSPFVANLKAPQETTMKVLPCFNISVRNNFQEPQVSGNCTIVPCFRVGNPYINAAQYALPSLLPNVEYDFFVLEAGQTAPAGALPIWEIPITDCTQGLSMDDIANAEYRYSITFSDGQEVAVLTGQNPIISFVGNGQGVAFNVTQTVTVGDCSATLDGGAQIGADYPFIMVGACGDLTPNISGRIDLTAYTVTGSTFDTAVTVTGAPDATIDLSANPDGTDAVEAAAIINAYFAANNIAGFAVGVGDVLVVQSPNVAFVDLDPAGTPIDFTKEYRLSMFDNTAYDAHDGLGSIEVRVYCQTQPAPVNPTFTALPSLEDINACSAYNGWEIEVILVTKLGCTFNLAATVDSADADYPANLVSFELAVV